MNKYKMISIVSFVLSCILVLSLLVPMRTIANDKESLEMSMHYEDAKVTVDISVNSEIYTGVICKYIIIDDVLKSDDLLAQTRDNGTTINLDKNENDKYTAVIPDVNKRYIVIYVSIGNCSLCDYLDCQPNKAENEEKQNQNDENEENNEHKQGVEGESVDGQHVEKTSDENKEPEQQPEENKEPEQQPEENKEPEQQPVENKEPEQKPAENKEPEQQPVENKEPEQKPVENKEPVQKAQENKQPEQKNVEQEAQKQDQNESKNELFKTASNTTNGNSGKILDLNNFDKDNIKSGDKDAIDISDFPEIEKTSTSTTADENMPKTGEDDFLKVFGIIVFSSISVVSFYKYKMTK